MREKGKYILGALGLKKGEKGYSKTSYRLGQNESEPTTLFMQALQQFFPDYHPVFLVTQEAEDKGWGDVEKIFGYSPEKIRVPDGKTEDQLWEFISDVLRHVQPNTQLILDITHGYRSMPLLTLQVGLLLQEMHQVSIDGVYYGAYEARNNDEVTPIFDLKPLLDLNDWTQALSTLSSLGQAQPLTEQLDKVIIPVFKKERRQPKEPVGLSGLSSALKDLGHALHTLRVREVFDLSRKIKDLVPKAEDDLERFPELRALTPYLQPSFKRFVDLAPELPGKYSEAAGIELIARLIRFYVETESYAKAITLSREALISLVAHSMGNNHTDRDARKQAEELLNTAAKESNSLEGFTAAANIWKPLHDLRNDVNHAGFRENPRRAQKLVKETKDLCGKTWKLILGQLM